MSVEHRKQFQQLVKDGQESQWERILFDTVGQVKQFTENGPFRQNHSDKAILGALRLAKYVGGYGALGWYEDFSTSENMYEWNGWSPKVMDAWRRNGHDLLQAIRSDRAVQLGSVSMEYVPDAINWGYPLATRDNNINVYGDAVAVYDRKKYNIAYPYGIVIGLLPAIEKFAK